MDPIDTLVNVSAPQDTSETTVHPMVHIHPNFWHLLQVHGMDVPVGNEWARHETAELDIA
jgi:hypothetical protein